MKIAIATAVYFPMINGVAVFSHSLAVGLAKMGHEVMVICPSQKGKGYTRVEDGVKVVYAKSMSVKVYPDQVHDVGEKKLWYKNGFKVSPMPKKTVERALNKFKPDVVHVQVADPIGNAAAGWARRHHVPLVTTEHNQPEVITEPLGVPKILKKPVEGVLSAYFVKRHSKSDLVTMPTMSAIENLVGEKKNFAVQTENEGFSDDFGAEKGARVPVMAVSNGVDLTNFRPGRVKKGIYEKYKIPRDVPVVLYVGRVDPEKKVGMVMEAFRAVLPAIPKAQLVIVGDGVDRARLSKQVKEMKLTKNIRMLGRVVGPDLYELYKLGWVFATASEIETQGIVLIEAAAVGLPLVAVDSGAVDEICIDNVNGFLCAPRDVPAMSSALTKILSDDRLRVRMAKASVKLAREHDFKKTLKKFEKIYKDLTEK